MKAYCLVASLTILMLHWAYAEIKNGYRDIQGARVSLRRIEQLLAEDLALSVFERMSLVSKKKKLDDYITYWQRTEEVLRDFKKISPNLFAEIDALSDTLGTSVDVYVAVVPEEEMPRGVAGATDMDPGADGHACVSEFGDNTISIRVASVPNNLRLLAHEFGHAKYQARHLASYFRYYQKFYGSDSAKGRAMGHNDRDPSGRSATEFTEKFRAAYRKMVR